MSLSGFHILIIGGNGNVGKRVAFALERLGARVKSVGRVAHAQEFQGSGIEYISKDFFDPDFCNNFDVPDYVLFLSWFMDPSRYWSDPENLRYADRTFELFKEFTAKGVRSFGFAGSCAEYMAADSDANSLGNAKRHLLDKVKRFSSEVRIQWFRIFFAYGPGEPKQKVIPSIIDGSIKKSSLKNPNGGCDFIHFVTIGEMFSYCIMKCQSGEFDIGSGQFYLLKSICEFKSSKIGIEPLSPNALAGTDQVVADLSWLEMVGVNLSSFQSACKSTLESYLLDDTDSSGYC